MNERISPLSCIVSKSSLLRALAVVLALALPCAAAAQPAADLKREAGVHFERGVELYQEGSLDAALVEFERAYELVPNFGLLYNLAQIQAERHEYPAAITLFERYLEEGKNEVGAERRGEVEEQLTKLRERVGQLWVESDLEGANLFIDDEPAGSLPMSKPLFVAAGVYRVRVERAGYRAATRKVKVAGGDQLRLEIPISGSPLLAAPTAAEAPPERADAPRNYRPAWVAGATAVALGGATLTFGLLTAKADRGLDAELDRIPLATAALAEQRKELKTFAGLTDGFAAATAVAVAVTVYLLVAPPRRRGDARSSQRVRAVARHSGLLLQGHF